MGIFTRTEATALAKNKDVDIPYGYTTIADDAFKFINANRITIPTSVTTIGRGVFYACPVKSILIPESVISIGAQAFYRCGYLTDITLPQGIDEIKHSTFERCGKLAVINIPVSVKHIGTSAFAYCGKLTDITIPHGMEEIKAGTFEGCNNLTGITIPDTVTRIEERAFKGCSKLKIYSSANSYARKYAGKGLFSRHKWVEIAIGAEGIITSHLSPAELGTVGDGFHNFLNELTSITHYIKDDEMLAQTSKLDAATRQILKFIAEHPDTEAQLDRKLLNYYFPTALKLIRTHIDVNQQTVRVGEMDKMIENIAPALDGITTALKNQLDTLYQTKSIDLSSDIDVLNHMLAMDGVKKGDN